MTIEWIVGVALALIGAVGGIIARDRFVMRLISSENEETREQTRRETDKLHERVNRIRDEYVRRTDLDNHIQRLDIGVQELRKEIRESTSQTNQRLDALLSHWTKHDNR